MISKWSPLAAILTLAPLAGAQVQPGDLVVTYPAYDNSTVEHYAYDGTVSGVLAPGIDDSNWIASAIMPDGRWAVNVNDFSAPEVRFYHPDGSFHDFFPYMYATLTEDLDVFSDSILAICSRDEGVLLFDDQGNSVGVLAPAGMTYPFGCFVTPDDTIWVADLQDFPLGDVGRIFHLDRQGTVLNQFDTPFHPSDVVEAFDGTLWISDYDGTIAHYQVDGTLITQFPAVIDSGSKTLWSLAVGDDGLVWATGHYDSMVRAYAVDGTVVTEFDTASPGHSTFTFTVPGASWAVPYCLGDGTTGFCPCGNEAGPGEGCMNSTGSGATLAALGSTDLAVDSLSFTALGMIPGQSALLFVANNQLNGGAGLPFGDGLRCAGGGLVRLGVEMPNPAGGAGWGPGLAAKGGWSAGDTRYFQVWYRDPSIGPCNGDFNLTHGLEVVFQP